MQMTHQEIAKIAERVEANALMSLQRAAPPDYAARFGVSVHHAGSAVAAVVSAVDAAILNRVVALGIDEEATEDQIEELLGIYGRAQVGFMVQVSPTAQPADLPARLEARGIERRDNWVRVFRGVEPPPAVATDLRIERIGPEYGEAYGEITCASFGMPFELVPWLAAAVGAEGWSHFLAFDGDIPVAAAALYIQDSAGWCGIASTLPTHRKRGAQGALFAGRIKDAAARGCRWLTSETWEQSAQHPNPSYHNMLRMGFEPVYMRANYIYE